jgi:glycine zipper 2TM protein
MPCARWSGAVLAGCLILGLAACARKTAETPANQTPAPTAAPTAAPTPAPTPSQAADASPVTADPVIASQRNAERRRQHRAAVAAPPAGAAEREREPRDSARLHEVPAGSILRVAFDQTISTATARAGETVPGETLDDLLADDGTVVAPSGSRVTGRIEQATASGRLGGQAELAFRLVELTPEGGRPVPIATSAYQRTGESHTKHDATYIAGGAAVGALLGQLLGKDTKSTVLGTAAGAAAGTGVAAATGQLDFEIQAGRTVAFTLEQPLRLPAAP